MSKQNQSDKLAEMQKWLIESAFDFLERAIEELGKSPKYSVIHFCSAVELFLKARLMMEHWTLVVAQNRKNQKEESKFNWSQFAQGNFNSVGLDECFDRLAGVTNTKLSKDDQQCLRDLAKHRNRAIHFYHEKLDAGKISLAPEQTRGWFVLKKLLSDSWRVEFKEYANKIASIEEKMRIYHPYLEQVFEEQEPKIIGLIESGVAFRDSPSCGFESFQETALLDSYIHREQCLVCGHKSFTSHTESGDHLIDDPSEILNRMNYDPRQIEVVGHCNDCDELNSVISIGGRYLCLRCLAIFDVMRTCDCCNAWNTSLPQDADGGGDVSALLGCVECDGQRDDSWAVKRI
jgi:hypothetical protein